MTIPLIGSKGEQETIIQVIMPGLPPMWARKADIAWGVLPLPCPIPGQINQATLAPLPMLSVTAAWSDAATKFVKVESFGGAVMFCDTPPWWNARTK